MNGLRKTPKWLPGIGHSTEMHKEIIWQHSKPHSNWILSYFILLDIFFFPFLPYTPPLHRPSRKRKYIFFFFGLLLFYFKLRWKLSAILWFMGLTNNPTKSEYQMEENGCRFCGRHSHISPNPPPNTHRINSTTALFRLWIDDGHQSASNWKCSKRLSTVRYRVARWYSGHNGDNVDVSKWFLFESFSLEIVYAKLFANKCKSKWPPGWMEIPSNLPGIKFTRKNSLCHPIGIILWWLMATRLWVCTPSGTITRTDNRKQQRRIYPFADRHADA